MKMSKVQKCEVENCAYNQNQICHALAITVGDTTHPKCDTFFSFGQKGGDQGATAGVGACKVAVCKFNESFECQASEISVGYNGQEVDCMTFTPK